MSLYQKPTPPIDITPTIEDRDLLSLDSLWDYFRLLGWILYDPHKLDVYIQRAKKHRSDPSGDIRWQNAYDALSWQVSLLVIGEMLIFLICYWLFSTLGEFDKWVNIIVGVALAASQIFVLIMLREEWNQALVSVPIYGTLCCMALVLLMEHTMQKSLFSYWIACSSFGLFCGAALHTFSYFKGNLPYSLSEQVVVGLSTTLLGGILLVFWHSDLEAGLGNIGGIIAFLFTITRFDDWLRGWFSLLRKRGDFRGETALQVVSENMLRVSAFPFYGLSASLRRQLESNWNVGLRSALNLRNYTRQKSLIERSIGQVLGATESAEVVERVAHLDGSPEWTLIDLIPPAESGLSWHRPFRRSPQRFFNTRSRREESLDQINPICSPTQMNMRLPRGTFAHAAIAGFYYLRHFRPDDAQNAFQEIQDSNLAREMETLSETLHLLNTSRNLSDAEPGLPALPANPRRAETWGILQNFREIIRLAWVLRCCEREEHITRLPEIMEGILAPVIGLEVEAHSGLAEAGLLSGIANAWKNSIDSMKGQDVIRPRRRAVITPFTHAEPLRERSGLLVGRSALLTRLRQALLDDELPLILIYGSRQTGKTSLFYNSVTGAMRSVHVSLRQVVRDTTRTHLLDIMSDLVEDELDRVSPNYRGLSQNPYKSFALYIRTICRDILPHKLLIVLDEFEYLDDVITSTTKRQDLVRYFHSLAQTEPNLHFVFVSTHTPSDIQHSYRRPFSTSLYRIEVNYLTEDDVRQLLRYPTQNFLPYCDDSAISQVMELTAGQPYLVQLMGFHLLHYYNDRLNADAPSLDPFFTRETINAILHSPDFRLQRNHYFLNLLDEVEQVDIACVELLQRIATRSGRIMPADTPDLNRLKEHDIVHKVNGRWSIRIRLFAQWLRDRGNM